MADLEAKYMKAAIREAKKRTNWKKFRLDA